MKQYILKKKIFAVLFMIAVFGFAGVNFFHGFQAIREEMEEEDEFSVEVLDAAITEELYGRMNFIELYAYVQILLDKREYNNFSYIKDEDNFLHYASFFREEDTELFEYALRIKRMQDYVEERGTRVLFVVPPGKYNSNEVRFRTGMPVNNPDSTVDQLMFYMNRLGVETLDLRKYFPNEELTYEETFFKTDHHWTIPAAFYATGILVDKMEECFGAEFDRYYTDIDQYEAVTYEGGMFGSMGRRTGANFCGVDNFTALWPRFPGQYYRESMRDNGQLLTYEGSFEETLMNTDALSAQKSIYSDSQYALYLDVIRPYEKVINEENPEGCRIFMVRDSYFSPVITFLTPMCGEIDAIWSLEKVEGLNIERYVKENEFDYIIVEVYPYNINGEAFNFFKKGEE